ncbi:MAG: hypothetical protein Kow0025_17490 [Thermodesulfovibrionales bacterium]
MKLELKEDERDILSHALKVYISDLREEIYKSEAHQTKPPLKKEEEVLKGILKRLEGVAVGS